MHMLFKCSENAVLGHLEMVQCIKKLPTVMCILQSAYILLGLFPTGFIDLRISFEKAV